MDNYPFYKISNNDFLFEIAPNYQYKVWFTESNYLLSDSSKALPFYDISFDSLFDRKCRKVGIINNEVLAKIRITIIEIMKYFISLNKCSLIFICDSIDRLEKHRFKIFQSWKNQYQSNKHLLTEEFYLPEDDITYYIGVIPFNNDHFEKIKLELDNPEILINK